MAHVWRNIKATLRPYKFRLTLVATTAITGKLLQHRYTEVFKSCGNPADVQSPKTVFWLRQLFGRTRSRIFGAMMETHIPVSYREPVFNAYAWALGIDLTEIRYPLKSYKSLAHVFARTLADGSRTIEASSDDDLVAPCDGQIVSIGDVDETSARLPQIKGSTYHLPFFVGSDPRTRRLKDTSSFKYCVIYLSPKNYHHFHSPCKFYVKRLKAFAGEVMPVFKGIASRVNDIFSINERVILDGKWKNGVMIMGAVAAYNVGNIRIKHEPTLRTNQLRVVPSHMHGDIITKFYDKDLLLDTGERAGEFRMGSTIVLIFEAPKSFEFLRGEGDVIRMGELLGH